jgi:hypothetical protein
MNLALITYKDSVYSPHQTRHKKSNQITEQSVFIVTIVKTLKYTVTTERQGFGILK